MFLVLLETSGNQNYIFSTNKLKENIGASELTYQAGTKWVLEAVKRETKKPWKPDEQLCDKLLDKANKLSSDNKVEIIVATSGKALLLTQDEPTAKNIIQYVTCKALKEAPGLDICGVFQEFNWAECNIGEINRQIHQKFQSVKSKRPALELRFLRLPVVAECSSSGFPASEFDQLKVESDDNNDKTKVVDNNDKTKVVYRSAITCSKRKYGDKGFERIAELLKRSKPDLNFARSVRLLNEELKNQDFPEELQETPDQTPEKKPRQLPWLAVIHADGNGLGEIFLNFDKHIKDSTLNCSQANRKYVDKLRRFSIALDICTEKAFLSALSVFESVEQDLLPIIPLILGGDDLTVICDGKFALKFTKKFLIEFEKETHSQHNLDGIIPEIIAGKDLKADRLSACAGEESLKADRLSACAGVAIIKNHFPFSVAYELAEKLMQSAKQVKKKVINSGGKPYPCSALDFHILYDSSAVELSKIREKIEIQNNGVKNKLYNKPYVLTSINDLQGANGLDWVKFHDWEKLQRKVDAILATHPKNKEKRQLPNSQLHELRAGLFLGKQGADARYQLIRGRYPGIKKLEEEPGSLFAKEPDSEIYSTSLLDAIDAADFL